MDLNDQEEKLVQTPKKLQLYPRKKYQSRLEDEEESEEEEESKAPRTRLQKIEKLIEGPFPKPKPNIPLENAKIMKQKASLLERMRPVAIDDVLYKPVLE